MEDQRFTKIQTDLDLMEWKFGKFPAVVAILQIILIVIFGILVEYGDEAGPVNIQTTTTTAKPTSENVENELKYLIAENGHQNGQNSISTQYPMFQDINVMIFIGFGFLMTFLKRYGFGAVGLNFIISAICIQVALIMQNIWHFENGKIRLGISNFISSNFATACVLISFGAVIGKANPLQLTVMAVVELIIFACNEYLGMEVFMAVDAGDSIFVHVFGAYFGLAVAYALFRKDFVGNIKEGSIYHSDLFAMIGTLFLWMFWPSFNSATSVGNDQHRAVINTIMALLGSCLGAFVISSALDKESRLDMVHIQNSTLAGGVVIGSAANMMVHPFGALITGFLIGCISVFGYRYLTPFMANRLRIHDTCGVNNLHGMPGIMAGIVSIIASAAATSGIYGDSLYTVFPAMVPESATSEFERLNATYKGIEHGHSFTSADQAVAQVKALACTLGVAIGSGLITGFVISQPIFDPPDKSQLYDDNDYWNVPEEAA